jgi:hypothetical protein
MCSDYQQQTATGISSVGMGATHIGMKFHWDETIIVDLILRNGPLASVHTYSLSVDETDVIVIIDFSSCFHTKFA